MSKYIKQPINVNYNVFSDLECDKILYLKIYKGNASNYCANTEKG